MGRYDDAEKYGYGRVRCPITGQIGWSDTGMCDCDACLAKAEREEQEEREDQT